ncbi:MAG: recombinase family protein [Candidatus Sulfotelmatobacter sp.]
MNPKLTVDRLRRRALIYVRQSSPGQVLHHPESQRLQRGLIERARELGFADVRIIDDLGRTGSGLVERPGFEHLVAEVCTGEVGAVFCLEASRLARNGREWHHLFELCGMVDAVVVDGDGIYDPKITNDRLLLGLKGIMSEYELTLLRQRSLETRRQKASRGELEFNLPVGLCWNASRKIEKDPDERVQQAIALVVNKMMELGSVRQVLVWFRKQNMSLPALSFHPDGPKLIWKPPVYRTVWAILSNPLYAGAYAYGRREVRTHIVEGRVRKSKGHRKSRSEWSVLIREHHPGYMDWEQYEKIQAMMASNTFMNCNGEAKAGRGGRALLSGMLRCRRCGRMLHVSYVGKEHTVPRYNCDDANLRRGERRCVSFSGLWVDEAVAKEVLQAVSGNAVEAALEAAEQMEQRRHELRQALALQVEEACYEARLAARRYEAVDPDQRLVAAELERRWNAALQKTRELEEKLQEFDLGIKKVPLPNKEFLLSLAQDLPAVWNAPSTDMRLKQRIVRILIEEIVADIDENNREIVLLIHWAGGRHSELRLKKRETGQHGRCTSLEAVEVVRRMAGRFSDELIAATLNRLGMHTGIGNTWDKNRVYSLRHHQQLPNFDLQRPRTHVSLKEAAQYLQVCEASVRNMIKKKKLPAAQVVEYAPWEIPVEALDLEEVRKIVTKIKNGSTRPQKPTTEEQQTMFSVP